LPTAALVHERGVFRNKEGRLELALADYAAYRE